MKMTLLVNLKGGVSAANQDGIAVDFSADHNQKNGTK
jgi:hypothetical protein